MSESAPLRSTGQRPSPAAGRKREFYPGAAALAWIWPGLGHISLGERRRGGLIMFGVLFLFLCGLLIGGVDVVDRQREWLWFLAQGLCGPIAFAADFVNQNYVQRAPDPERLRGLARVHEMGTLFIALAGLMNLVVILDALHFAPPGGPADRRAEHGVRLRRASDAPRHDSADERAAADEAGGESAPRPEPEDEA
jgi:hypothetical protein